MQILVGDAISMCRPLTRPDTSGKPQTLTEDRLKRAEVSRPVVAGLRPGEGLAATHQSSPRAGLNRSRLFIPLAGLSMGFLSVRPLR